MSSLLFSALRLCARGLTREGRAARPMLSRANNEALGGDESKDPELAANQALLNSRSYQTGTEEEKRVLELVSLLANNSKNKVAAIKQFEEWFFETRPRLPQTAISCLLQGESGGPHDGGLLQTCGDVNSTHVSRHAALDLLCRLIDVERNKEAQNYVDELAKVDLRVIKRMQLHMHIASERGTRLGAFQIIAAIKSRLPGVLLEQYVADPRARAEFNQWAARKNESAAASAAEPAETVIRSVNMAEVAPRAISEEALTEVLAIATSEAQWIVVKRGDGDGQVKVMYRVDHRRSDLVVVRVMARLPCDVDTATKVLIDFGLRKEWDIMFHRGRRVESIDKTTDLVHFVFKSFSSPYKYRDFCLLRSWFKRDEIGGRVIVERSVIHPRVPEQKDHVRAVLFPSGYVITHMDEAPAPPSTPGAPTATQSGKKGCLLTWVAQMDRESVMIVSPELLGETDQLTQSVRNLMHLVASQPPSV